MAKDKGSKGSAGTASGTPPAGGGGTGTTEAVRTNLNNLGRKANRLQTWLSEKLNTTSIETLPNTVIYITEGQELSRIAFSGRTLDVHEIWGNKPNAKIDIDFSNEKIFPPNENLFGRVWFNPLTEGPRLFKPVYPDNNEVCFMTDKSSHKQSNPVEGLHVVHRYRIEVKDVDCKNGVSVTLRFNVSITLTRPIIAFNRGDNVLVEVGNYFRSIVQKAMSEINTGDIIKRNTDSAGKETISVDAHGLKNMLIDQMPGIANKIKQDEAKDTTCREQTGYMISDITSFDTVLPDSLQKVVDAIVDQQKAAAGVTTAQLEAEQKIAEARGNVAEETARLAAQANHMKNVATILEENPNCADQIVMITTSNTWAPAVKENKGTIVMGSGFIPTFDLGNPTRKPSNPPSPPTPTKTSP